MASILIIDDDHLFCKMLSQVIEQEGHTAASAHSIRDGLSLAESGAYDLVFLDVSLPDGNGLEALPGLRAVESRPEIIIITGEGDPDGAELAITNGAWDYIEKQQSMDKVVLPLTRALEYRSAKPATSETMVKRLGIIGSSPALLDCLRQLSEAASSEANVLIAGETGTGKELFARAIHRNSPRADHPFVVVDCGALPKSLLESELFGHVKGSFTGAQQDREGLIKLADGGTLFLDEIGELPLSHQKAFLRVLQERTFRPVGGKNEIHSDFRLICATNKNLDAMAAAGRFREDLLFRLKSLLIQLPPLRERGDDTRELAAYWVRRLCEQYNLNEKDLSPDILEALRSHSWPGNIRELFNVLERTLLAAKSEPMLYATHLPTHIRIAQARSKVAGHSGNGSSSIPESRHEPPPPWRDYREHNIAEMERRYLLHIIEYTSGNITQASRVSGLSRQRLHTLLKKHGLVRSYSRSDA